MARGRIKNSIRKIHLNKAEGRGRFYKGVYKPGIYTYEFPSKGKTARIKGLTSERVHHCLSQHEKYFFMLLDYDPAVSQIYEQYFLSLESTLLIAAEQGIPHPYANQCPAQMSTDFLYCMNGNWYAVAIKTTEDLQKKRTREKLEIERLYWEKKGIPWRIVTEKDIPRQKALNLYWLHSGEPLDKLIPDVTIRENLIAAVQELYQNYSVPFQKMVEEIETLCHLRNGTVLQIFKHLVKSNIISIDINKPINTVEPRSFSWLESQISSNKGDYYGDVS